MNSDPIDFKTFEEYEKFCAIKVYLGAFAITVFFLMMFIASRNFVPLILVSFISAAMIIFETNICRYGYDTAWAELKSYASSSDESDMAKAREIYFRNKQLQRQTRFNFNTRSNNSNTGNNFSLSF